MKISVQVEHAQGTSWNFWEVFRITVWTYGFVSIFILMRVGVGVIHVFSNITKK